MKPKTRSDKNQSVFSILKYFFLAGAVACLPIGRESNPASRERRGNPTLEVLDLTVPWWEEYYTTSL